MMAAISGLTSEKCKIQKEKVWVAFEGFLRREREPKVIWARSWPKPYGQENFKFAQTG